MPGQPRLAKLWVQASRFFRCGRYATLLKLLIWWNAGAELTAWPTAKARSCISKERSLSRNSGDKRQLRRSEGTDRGRAHGHPRPRLVELQGPQGTTCTTCVSFVSSASPPLPPFLSLGCWNLHRTTRPSFPPPAQNQNDVHVYTASMPESSNQALKAVGEVDCTPAEAAEFIYGLDNRVILGTLSPEKRKKND